MRVCAYVCVLGRQAASDAAAAATNHQVAGCASDEAAGAGNAEIETTAVHGAPCGQDCVGPEQADASGGCGHGPEQADAAAAQFCHLDLLELSDVEYVKDVRGGDGTGEVQGFDDDALNSSLLQTIEVELGGVNQPGAKKPGLGEWGDKPLLMAQTFRSLAIRKVNLPPFPVPEPVLPPSMFPPSLFPLPGSQPLCPSSLFPLPCVLPSQRARGQH